MKCADCRFYEERNDLSRCDGVCRITLPTWITDAVDPAFMDRRVYVDDGCDIGQPKEVK